jgi:enoyl-CoA hydratase/carnithine racemase
MQFFDELEQIEKPVLAAINGPCTGAGLQVTLSCDLRIASDQSKFGFRENNIGLIPGAGGCSRLVKLIGYGKAKELIFTGEMISAEEAERTGLVNRVVPHDELMNHTRALAEHLLTRAPEALGLAKRVLWHSVNSDFQTGRTLEALAQSVLLKTGDHREGVRAFREKRKPRFKGE